MKTGVSLATLLALGTLNLPASAQSDPMAEANPDMAKALTALKAFNGKPIETLTVPVAREQPSAADTTKVVMKAMELNTAPDPAVAAEATR